MTTTITESASILRSTAGLILECGTQLNDAAYRVDEILSRIPPRTVQCGWNKSVHAFLPEAVISLASMVVRHSNPSPGGLQYPE